MKRMPVNTVVNNSRLCVEWDIKP